MMSPTRIKWVLAAIAVVATTSLMWSDRAISWWSEIVLITMQTNHDATISVMNHRPNGDADLHAILWGVTALFVLIACASRAQRLRAVGSLGAWSVFVEISQPWFTDLRSRQATDLVGNVIGVVGILIIFEFATKRITSYSKN